MTEKEVIAFNRKNVQTGMSKKGYGQTYFASRDFKKGEELVAGFGRLVNHQTSHSSVQIGYTKHFVPTKWTAKYWNHSCNPNAYIKTRRDGFPTLFALKNIKQGEEITYAYWMTELEWSKHAKENRVNCLCGEKKCRGKILSFSQLSKKEQTVLQKKGLCPSYLTKDSVTKLLKTK